MKFFSYLLFFKLTFAIAVTHAAPDEKASAKTAAKVDFVELKQDLTESNIARLVAKILEHSHYSQREFDDDVSGKFLDRYFEILDGQHLHFLQSDVAEFESYRTKLDEMTEVAGDTKPAHLIFARMMERVGQRVAYVNELLKTEKFEFTGNDRYTPNRKDLPRPKNMDEARQLWRQNLRFEFLQEKLSQPQTKKVHANLEKSEQTNSISEPPSATSQSFGETTTGQSRDQILEETTTTLKRDRTPRKGLGAEDLMKKEQTVPKIVTKTEVLAKTNGLVMDEKFAPSKTTNTVTNAVTNAVTNVVKKTEPPRTPKETIAKRYSTLERTLKELSGDDVFEIYMTALARVYDPHSDYMGHSQFENFNISMKLSLFGIGALLQSEDGYCKIKELMSGPAMKSNKIKPGDRIVAVAQGDKEPVDVVDMKLNKVVELIRGPKGTEVRLTVWPADAVDSSMRKVVALIRDVIKLEDQEAKAKVIEIPNKKETVRLGVIDLPSFYSDMDPATGTERKSTTADVAKLLKKLNQEKVSGVILDLRRNGGGLLEEAVNLTGLFITNGPVVQVKDQDGEIITMSDSDSSIVYQGPLIILTSHFSASASEILAGALQDYGRALIVGDTSTFGKGTVQRVLKLDPYMDQNKLSYAYDPGALKPTTAKFYRAGGSSTQLRGVIPDLKLPTVLDYAEVGEASMDYPLPWDEVSTATFHKWNLVKPYLPELQKRSDRRLPGDKEYSYIREDIELFKKSLADKSISLNEQTRLKEKKEIDAREEARKKERKSRQEPEQKVFEVTLKNADEPGLQLYVPKTNDVAAAKSESPDDEAALEDKVPVVDAALRESERILLDYISLLPAPDPALSKVE